MGDMQATIGGTDVDGSDGRTIHGDFDDSTSHSGDRVIMFDVLIQGADAETFQTNVATARAAFTKRQVVCSGTIDDAAATNRWSVGPDDGDHVSTSVAMVPNAGHAKTATSEMFTIVIHAQSVTHIGTDIASLEGLESFTFTRHFGPGRVEARVVTGRFTTTTNAKDGLTNYTNAKATLLTTYCLTDNDGSRNTTNKFVLVDEQIENLDGEDRVVEFRLESQVSRFVMATADASAGVRETTLKIKTETPDAWFPQAGARPTIVTVEGAIHLSYEAYSSGVWQAFDAYVKPDILTALATEIGSIPVVRWVKTHIATDPNDGLMAVNLTLQVGNSVNLQYSRSDSIEVTEQYSFADVTDGTVYLQESPVGPAVKRQITVEREGSSYVADLLTSLPSPRFSGRQVVPAKFGMAHVGAFKTEFSNNTFKQSAVYGFVEVKLTNPAAIQPRLRRVGV